MECRETTEKAAVKNGPDIILSFISSLPDSTEIEVTSETDGSCRIIFPAEYTWICDMYMNVNDVKAEKTEEGYSFDITGEELAEFIASFSTVSDDSASNLTELIHGLTPDGNLTLVDDYGTRTGEGQQFITLVTKAGNYFYLIIDRDDKGGENVHFLNMVDERDLFALMEEGEAADFQSQSTADKESKKAVEKTSAPTQSSETKETEPSGSDGDDTKKSVNKLPLLLAVVLISGIGVAWFFLQKKKKHPAEAADPDAGYTDDEDYGAGQTGPNSETDPYEDEILNDDSDESEENNEEE